MAEHEIALEPGSLGEVIVECLTCNQILHMSDGFECLTLVKIHEVVAAHG